MVQTRAQEQGKPLKKPGAYDTDAYYAEKDDGFGDVGVDQEPDAGRKDNPSDPDFNVTADEDRAATQAAQEDVAADVPLKEDVADLKAGPTEQVGTQGRDGAPVEVVPTSTEEVEEQERFDTAA